MRQGQIYINNAQLAVLVQLAEGTFEYGLDKPVVYGFEIEGNAASCSDITARAVLEGHLEAVASATITGSGLSGGWQV